MKKTDCRDPRGCPPGCRGLVTSAYVTANHSNRVISEKPQNSKATEVMMAAGIYAELEASHLEGLDAADFDGRRKHGQ